MNDYFPKNLEVESNAPAPEDFFVHKACDTPKITFVVPVYNMDKYIARCLKSLLNQTFEEIEVICVDDASTDDTGSVLRSIASRDKRLTVITFPENRTANQARKDAVLASRGEYILFCDADDTYSPDACEKLYSEMLRDPVDILHFGVNVINCGDFESDKAWLNANLIPYFGSLRGKDVFEACFSDGPHRAAYIWNKMYSAPLAKKAFSYVEDGCLLRGEDLYAFALLSYFADSYRGIAGERFYHYHFGLGGEGILSFSPSQFSRFFCSGNKITEALNIFFESEGLYDEYRDIWQNIRSTLIEDCVHKWHTRVSAPDKGICYDMMLKAWPGWMIAESVARRYWHSPGEAMELLGASNLRKISKDVKVIGMYYHRLVNGGTERVIQLLTPLLTSMGYRVVILTDMQGPDDFIPLPEGVKRYMIPNHGIGRPQDYFQRAGKISEIIHAEGIDVMVHHAWDNPMLAWDMLVIKSAGAAFVVHCHNIFSVQLLSSSDYFAAMPKVFGYADGIVCLSEVDECFWKRFNANVFIVLNPPTFDIRGSVPSELTEKNILWVGRIDPQKCPEDALHIFKKVLLKVPEARLQIVGKSEKKEDTKRLEKLAKKLRISGAVEFCGYQEDVSPFFTRASALLCTSKHEGFPLVLFESKIFGVPIVMYELPYLTLSAGNHGIFPAPLGDTDGAAGHLVHLLTDEDARFTAGAEARAHALELAAYDYAAVWRSIFDSLACPGAAGDTDDAESFMWDTLLNHYAYGVRHQNEQSWAAVRAMKRTWTWRIGRIFVAVPRLIHRFIKRKILGRR